jgi:hypothetical protein
MEQRVPQWPSCPASVSQELQRSHDRIERVRDLQQHRRCRDQTQSAPGSDHDGLNDDEEYTDRSKRHDQDSEQQHQPWDSAPAPLVANDAGDEFYCIDSRAQPCIGDGPCFRHGGCDDPLGAVAEKRIRNSPGLLLRCAPMPPDGFFMCLT